MCLRSIIGLICTIMRCSLGPVTATAEVLSEANTCLFTGSAGRKLNCEKQGAHLTFVNPMIRAECTFTME
jgi:LytS/YehU family sensor histidine kinase